jgi:hypothetical protein
LVEVGRCGVNTWRSGSRFQLAIEPGSRRLTMSRRSCSCHAVFFARDLVAVKEAPQRAGACQTRRAASAVLSSSSVMSRVSSTSARMAARTTVQAHQAPVAPQPPLASRRPAPVPSSGRGSHSRRSLQNGSPPADTTGPTISPPNTRVRASRDLTCPRPPSRQTVAITRSPIVNPLRFKAMHHALEGEAQRVLLPFSFPNSKEVSCCGSGSFPPSS